MRIVMKTIKLPADIINWKENIADGFIQFSSFAMKVYRFGGSEDANLTRRLNAGRAVALKKKQTQQAEVSELCVNRVIFHFVE